MNEEYSGTVESLVLEAARGGQLRFRLHKSGAVARDGLGDFGTRVAQVKSLRQQLDLLSSRAVKGGGSTHHTMQLLLGTRPWAGHGGEVPESFHSSLTHNPQASDLKTRSSSSRRLPQANRARPQDRASIAKSDM